MIANLPATEKQAFFGLLDEYFASRPHRLPPAAASSAAPATPQRGGIGGLSDRATSAAGNAAGAAAGVAVTNALRDQFARTGLGGSKGAPPPAPSASKKPGFSVPAGLTSGKTFGSLNLGSRTISNTQTPAAAPITSPTRTLPPPTKTGAGVPPPAAPAAAQPAVSHPQGTLGTAQVLYDYGDGSDPDDLQATEGEQIWLTEKISDDWWRAMSHDQSRQGIIPSAYVSASLY
ncbi:Src homology-3 domain protein [Kalmanozyma brasiliensis GHG001]|uniref:Src homology-3 domain protein n=1 Tax=Kalmanozyma brasiliensis (strain GHG001) TaxID=1365824 RepID=UPI001CE725CD|nr:Src homology-3 domain protein [Kalmanozyma brasiliensis GHG001]KAF6767298.1 Src homology-3 domain protein [Kalmanozyma brasiliensis GHG001]